MPVYAITGRYTAHESGGTTDRPEDRETKARRSIELTGGKLLGYYIMFGDCEWLLIAEHSDAVAVLSAIVLAEPSGSVAPKLNIASTSAQANLDHELARNGVESVEAAARGTNDKGLGSSSVHRMLANEG
ncbi:MAG: GYD domain-containing protein [Alphaproteobacteria bacterium]|nr:GYD domain-containing protein [Alphaproteobacteria bacterium]